MVARSKRSAVENRPRKREAEEVDNAVWTASVEIMERLASCYCCCSHIMPTGPVPNRAFGSLNRENN